MGTADHPGHRGPSPADDRPSRRANRVFFGFLVIALVMLAVEHRAHVLGWLPWLFLLACPLMHFFMHGGHGGHGGHGHRQPPGDDK